jgi:hypothetical protein
MMLLRTSSRGVPFSYATAFITKERKIKTAAELIALQHFLELSCDSTYGCSPDFAVDRRIVHGRIGSFGFWDFGLNTRRRSLPSSERYFAKSRMVA